MQRTSLPVLTAARRNRDYGLSLVLFTVGVAWLAVLGAYIVVRDVLGWL